MDIPTLTNLHANTLPPWINLYIKNCTNATHADIYSLLIFHDW